MKIVTLNPPFYDKFSKDSRSPGVSKGGCVYYPIWLGYCTGLLEKQGHEVKLMDCPAEGMTLEKCLQVVKEFNPRMIVVQTVTASFNNDIMVVEELKKILPNVFIALVGDHTSAVPIESLKASKFVDCVTIQEFDFTVKDIAIALDQGKDISTVKGIVYRKIDSEGMEEFKFTLPRELISGQELDEFPFVSDVYKKHLTIENYFYPSVLYPEVTIITGRGCKYRCTFCVDRDTVIAVEENGKTIVDTISNFVDKYLNVESEKIHGYEKLNVLNKDLLVWSNGEKTKIKNISRTKTNKVLKIALEGGKTISLTPEHIVPVKIGKKVREIQAGEVKLEDKLLFSKKLFSANEVKELNLFKELLNTCTKEELKDVYIQKLGNYFDFLENKYSDFQLIKKSFKNYWIHYKVLPINEFNKLIDKFDLPQEIAKELEVGGKNLRSVPFVLPINAELMKLIGMFVSEGHYNQYNIVITKNDEKIVNEIQNWISKLFPKTYVTISRQKNKTTQIFFGGKIISLLFKHVLAIPSKAVNKKLPRIVFNVSQEMKNNCLKALFSGDGSWDKARKIKFYSTSETLINQVGILLTQQDINYSILEEDHRGPMKINKKKININYKIFRLNINIWDDRQRFIENIGFFDERQKLIEEFQGKYKPNRVRVLEQIKNTVLSSTEIAQNTNMTEANVRQTLMLLRKEGKIATINSSKVKYSLKEDEGILRNRIKEWLEVIDIEEVNEETTVYDLETENNYFTVNGLVVHNCKWPQTLTMHEYRARSVKNVVDEFEWIEKNLPEVKDIMIEDDTLTQDKTRTIELCKEVVARGLKIFWTCNSRADIDLETMEWMKKAHCRLMCVGFESADQQILNNIKKGTMIPKIKQFVVDAKKAGILIHGCFMLGNKGETKETINKTVQMAKELDPDTAQFFPIMVYPGTEAYKWAEENGFLKTKDWSKWLLPDGTHNSIVSTDKLTSEELVRECDKARIAFYLRPAFIFRKLNQVVKNPLKEFPRFLISTWIFSKYLAKEVKETLFPTPSSKTTISSA